MKKMSLCLAMLVLSLMLTACGTSRTPVNDETTVPSTSYLGDSMPDAGFEDEEVLKAALYEMYPRQLVEQGKEILLKNTDDPDLIEAFPFTPVLVTYTSPEGRTVYLFGTSPAYDADTPWFPAYAQEALDESAVFITIPPEGGYTDEELAYAADVFARRGLQLTDGQREVLNAYRDYLGGTGPQVEDVSPIYWSLLQQWDCEKQMNHALWDMAEEKNRVMAYSGTDVIDRLNALDQDTKNVIAFSSISMKTNETYVINQSMRLYYAWLTDCCYNGNEYIELWWDNYFYCSGIPEYAETFSELLGGYTDTSCNGSIFNCVDEDTGHYYFRFANYSVNVFQPNCSDIMTAINEAEGDGPIFLALDTAYLYTIADLLTLDNYTLTQWLPFAR